MEECTICFRITNIDSYINGCEHKFCFDCISTWAVNNRAFCPMCNQPIFGLISDELYLSPHYGQFGIFYKNSLNKLQVACIIENSVASMNGIKEGDNLYVNGSTTFFECEQHMKEARKRGRMIHVKANSSNDSLRSQNINDKHCCFWRFWKDKTATYVRGATFSTEIQDH